MDIDLIRAEEARYLREMRVGHQQKIKDTASPAQRMFRQTTELQKRSDHIKMRMIAGDRDVSMAQVVQADAEAKLAFDKTNILVKRVSEGLKTILNTPL